jgi:glycosyltransferase involved in cell wall biosynthesis
MRILWVATKAPWPVVDGGRQLAALTVDALAAEGVEVVVVAPVGAGAPATGVPAAPQELRLVPAAPAGPARAFLRARWHGLPFTVSRHRLEPVRRAVEECLARDRFDAVHAEQLQAWPQCEPARRRGVPVLLRAQNVETDLWAALAATRGRWGRLVRGEVARLAHYEGQAVRAASTAVAVTARDAVRLRGLAGAHAVVHHVAAPFPDRLPGPDEPLPGAPAVVVLAGGWLPNQDGAAWFLREVWPAVRARSPGAVLHLFGASPGAGRPGSVVAHAPVADSRTAFAPGAILAVPLRIASGVRMKILEAWARGVPVVATPEAAAGLDARDGHELRLARSAGDFADAIRGLHRDPATAAAGVEAGRALLRARHDPRRVARRLVEIYASLGSAAPTRPP